MKIKSKISISIFVIAVLALAIISTCFIHVGRKTILESAHKTAMHEVKEQARVVSEILEEKFSIAKTMGSAPIIMQSLATSNDEFFALPKGEREKKIIDLNHKWIDAKDGNDSFIKGYTANSVADYFKKQQGLIEGEYGEIFLTNRYGVLVASTGRLSTLAHSHKYWWRSACEVGDVIDDRGYDDSVGDRVFGVVVPIIVDGKFAGILKSNLLLKNPVESFLEPRHVEGAMSEGQRIVVLRANGNIVAPEEDLIDQGLIDAISVKMKKDLSQSEIVTHGGMKSLVAYAPVELSFAFSDKESVSRYSPEDHRGGNYGHDWYVLFVNDLDSIYFNSELDLKTVLLSGLLLILIILIPAYYVSSKLTSPISKFIKGTEKVGRGDYSGAINVTSNDEIGDLAQSYNEMTLKLASLTVSKEYVSNILNSMSDSLIVISPEEEIIMVNKGVLKLLDYQEGELLGSKMDVLFADESLKYIKLNEIIEKGSIIRDEIMFKTKGNRKIPILLSSSVVKKKCTSLDDCPEFTQGDDDCDKVQAIVISAKDISDIKMYEEELSRYEQIVSSSTDLLALVNENFVHLAVNKAYEDEFDSEGKGVVGRTMADLFGRETAEKIILPNATRCLSGETVSFETWYSHKGSESKYYEVVYNPYMNEVKTVKGFVISARDITERKKMVDAALENEKLASIGQLAGGIAHEVNNPNNFIMLSVSRLQKGWDDVSGILDEYFEANGDFNVAGMPYSEYRKEVGNLFGSLFRGSHRIKMIVHSLKSFLVNKEDTNIEKVKLESALANAKIILDNLIKKNTDHFSINVNEGVPSVWGTFQHLEQVLINLIQNACQSLDSLDKHVIVNVRYDAEIDKVILEVSDEGCGMPDDVLSKVTKPFFTTRQREKGLGLGMSIVDKILDEIGASMEIDSVVGQGTTVRLYLLPISLPFPSS